MKIAIIGGGVSGLSAGIQAQLEGFEVDLYEKNVMLGGECTGWNRQGYHIDNCIHFLTGCRPGNSLHDLWKKLHVLEDDTPIVSEPYFYALDTEEVRLCFWNDLKRAKDEFLRVSPEDAKELNLFFDCVKLAECIMPPVNISPAHMNFFQNIQMALSMKDAAKPYKEYGKQTMLEFSKRFKHPFIRDMMLHYFPRDFYAITLVTAYSFYSRGTVGIPEGGSTGMISRMKKHLESLGGKIHVGISVNGFDKANGKIRSMSFENGEKAQADAYVWCADPWSLFYEMVGEEHMDENLKWMYENPKDYVANTGYQAAFGITTDEELDLPKGSVLIPCSEFKVLDEVHRFMGVRVYDYDETLFPKDKRVIQCNILLNTLGYDAWEDLYQNREQYQKEKERIAHDLQERIETKYPQLKDKLILLGTYSPVTFKRWCNAYKGAYMSFNALHGVKTLYVKSTVKGLNNLFLGSQWVQNSGGLPVAAASGKFAIQQLKKRI